jgi:uncharacterized membrane protein YfcA
MNVVLLVIIIAAFVGSILTFFSGFGLGTILVAVFTVFFAPELAIAMTAIVHLFNNIFKLILTHKHVNRSILLRFGVPSVIASLIGALVLIKLGTYSSIQGVFGLQKIIGLVFMAFALFELFTALRDVKLNEKYLTFGGIISGFFGGFSGHQGALRSAFLAKAGMSKEELIGTSVVIACFIDISRLIIYRGNMKWEFITDNKLVLLAAIISACCGAFLGNKFLKKTRLQSIQYLIFGFLFLFGLYLVIK